MFYRLKMRQVEIYPSQIFYNRRDTPLCTSHLQNQSHAANQEQRLQFLYLCVRIYDYLSCHVHISPVLRLVHRFECDKRSGHFSNHVERHVRNVYSVRLSVCQHRKKLFMTKIYLGTECQRQVVFELMHAPRAVRSM